MSSTRVHAWGCSCSQNESRPSATLPKGLRRTQPYSSNRPGRAATVRPQRCELVRGCMSWGVCLETGHESVDLFALVLVPAGVHGENNLRVPRVPPTCQPLRRHQICCKRIIIKPKGNVNRMSCALHRPQTSSLRAARGMVRS